MGIGPFAASAKLSTRTDAKLPKPRLIAAERLRRLEEAITFLSQQLATGPQPAKTLLQAAKSAGIAERTLHRAKDVLGVTTEHTGWHGQWIWKTLISDSVSQAAIPERYWQLGEQILTAVPWVSLFSKVAAWRRSSSKLPLLRWEHLLDSAIGSDLAA